MSWYLLGLDTLYNYVTGNTACNAFDTLCQQTGGVKTYLDCIPDMVEPVVVPALNAAAENYSPLNALLAGAAVVATGAALVYGYCRYRGNHTSSEDSLVQVKQERDDDCYFVRERRREERSSEPVRIDRRFRLGSARNPIFIED
jgi:hypothetical protein